MNIEEISASVTRHLWQLGEQSLHILVPLLAALLILLLGLYLSRFVSSGAKKLLNKISFDDKTGRLGINELCLRFGLGKSPTYIISFVLAWSVILYAIILAANILHLHVISQLFARFLTFVPTLFAAVVILFAGMLFGKLVGSIIENSSKANNLKGGVLLSRGVNVFIVGFSALVAVETLGFATQLVSTLVTVILASLGLAFAISVGLGARPLVEEFLRDLFKKEEK